jgi:hypothetical protein
VSASTGDDGNAHQRGQTNRAQITRLLSRPELSVPGPIMKSELMSPRLPPYRDWARRLAEKKLEPSLLVHGFALLVGAQDFFGLGTGPSGLLYDQWTVEYRFALVPQ